LNRRSDVLLVPNAALRWQPSREQVAPQFQETLAANTAANDPSDGTRPTLKKTERARGDVTQRGVLWVLDGEQLRPVQVRIGLTDGGLTEVEGEQLAEGLEIIIGQQNQAVEGSDTTNPFAPKIPRRGSGSTKRTSGS
jgi:HlyD family secretion protein